MEHVVTGVDPHKLSATFVVVDDHERTLGTGRFSGCHGGNPMSAPSSATGRTRPWVGAQRYRFHHPERSLMKVSVPSGFQTGSLTDS